MVEIGSRTSVKGDPGTVRFIGTTQFAPGEWVGVELDKPTGRNDGSLQGVKYFECLKPGNYGVFVRKALLEGSSGSSDVQQVVSKLQDKLRAAKKDVVENQQVIAKLTTELHAAQKRADAIEATMEATAVDTEYLRDHNATLVKNLEDLQEKYDDLVANHAILSEEMELNRELEEAVRTQSADTISSEDFHTLLQHNKKLELAVNSLKKMADERETVFSTRIKELSEKADNSTALGASYNALAKKLEIAEATIAQLQEQLESVSELEQIVEHLTRQNEQLHSQVSTLTKTVDELTELHELDKSLEAGHLSVEHDLQEKINKLMSDVKKEKALQAELSAVNKRLEKDLQLLKANELSKSTPFSDTDIEATLVELRKLKADNATTSAALLGAQLKTSAFSDVSRKLVNELNLNDQFEIVFISKSIEGLCPATESHIEPNALIYTKILLGFQTCRLELAVKYATRIAERYYDHSNINWQSLLEALKDVETNTATLVQKIKQNEVEAISWTFVETFVSYLDMLLAENTDLAALRLSYRLSLTENSMLNARKICKHFAESAEFSTHSSISELSNVLDKVFESSTERAKDVTQSAEEFSWILDDSQSSVYDESSMVISTLLAILKDIASIQSSEVENDTQNDLPNVEEILQKSKSVMEQLETSVKKAEVTSTHAIYSALSRLFESSNKSLRDEHSLVTSQLVLKDQKIQDLLLNIQHLETNMKTSLAGKELEKVELQKSMEAVKHELASLKTQYEESMRANKALQSQLDSLFNSDSRLQHHQIPVFEDLKSRQDYTTEMALLDEIALLKTMANAGTPSDTSHEWLDQDILPPKPKGPGTESIKFLKHALNIRAKTDAILRSILQAHDKNSEELSYRRSTWKSF